MTPPHQLANGRHLGKLPATHDPRDLTIEDVMVKAPGTGLPTAPHTIQGIAEAPVEWGMLGNGPDDSVFAGFDGAGDCTIAGPGHEHQGMNALAGSPVPKITGKQSIADYSALSGYDPRTGANDTGLNVRDVLNYRRSTGIQDATGQRHKIGAYFALEPGNPEHLALALLVADFVGIGIQFPQSAMGDFQKNREWVVHHGSPIEGGHYMVIGGRLTTRVWQGLTWGQVVKLSQGFLTKFCDEAWGILSLESIKQSGVNPYGLSYDAVNAFLGKL